MDYDIQNFFTEANWISQSDLKYAYKRWVGLFDQKNKPIKHLGEYREVLMSIYEPFLKWVRTNKRTPEKLNEMASTNWSVYIHRVGIKVPLIFQDLQYPRSDKLNPPIKYFRVSNDNLELLERFRLTDDDPNPDDDITFKRGLKNKINGDDAHTSYILELSDEPSETPLNGWGNSEENIVISFPKMDFMNTSIVLSPPLLLAVIDWSASKESLLASIEKLKSLVYFPSEVGRPKTGFTPKLSDFEELFVGQINKDRKPKNKIIIGSKNDSTLRMRFIKIKEFIDPVGTAKLPKRPSSPKSRINSMQKRYVK